MGKTSMQLLETNCMTPTPDHCDKHEMYDPTCPHCQFGTKPTPDPVPMDKEQWKRTLIEGCFIVNDNRLVEQMATLLSDRDNIIRTLQAKVEELQKAQGDESAYARQRDAAMQMLFDCGKKERELISERDALDSRAARAERELSVKSFVLEALENASRGVSTCGHNQQYLYSPDGQGKRIFCAVCKLHQSELAQANLRYALTDVLSHRNEDNEGNHVAWLGETTFELCQQALSSTPSTGWVRKEELNRTIEWFKLWICYDHGAACSCNRCDELRYLQSLTNQNS